MTSFLLASFRAETEDEGEQIRLALSEPGDPTRWAELAGGRPVLVSDVGEGGVRDPFLVRDPRTGRVHVIATDLRVAADGDWDRAVRHGSRSIVVWSTDDFRAWDGPHLVPVSPPEAGNTWAPKAVWSPERGAFLMIWASALYPEGDRGAGSHQRLLCAETGDFRSFGPVQTYLDPGHDVIDAVLLPHGDHWYRFSANAHGAHKASDIGHHIFVERGRSIDDPAFEPVRVDLGKPELERGEGPAVFVDPDSAFTYVLVDEFALRGYQLFRSLDPGTDAWEHVADARLPAGARHGSVLAVTEAERRTLAGLR